MNARTLLTEHHHVIERACADLLQRGNGASFERIAAYRRFEQAMLDLLRIEEELLLPGYAEHARDAARELRDRHDDLRRMLFRVGIDVELHAPQDLDRLIAEVRTHATREAPLYARAASHLPAGRAEQLADRLLRSSAMLGRVGTNGPEIAVRRAITKALGRHAVIESAHLRIDVIDDEVEVAGTVDSQHEHDVAIAAAERVPGVRRVIDRVAINP